MELARSDKTALVIGGTGPIMKQCVVLLKESDNYSKIVLFNSNDAKKIYSKIDVHVWDFERIKSLIPHIKGNDIYIDRFILSSEKNPEKRPKLINSILEFCKIALQKGANQCIICTSANSGETSNFHISRSYAELEKQISALPFWAIHIFRPSIILDEPINNNFGERIASRIGKGLDFITGGLVSRYSPIEADKVALAMVTAAQKTEGGIAYYQNEQIAKQSTWTTK